MAVSNALRRNNEVKMILVKTSRTDKKKKERRNKQPRIMRPMQKSPGGVILSTRAFLHKAVSIMRSYWLLFLNTP